MSDADRKVDDAIEWANLAVEALTDLVCLSPFLEHYRTALEEAAIRRLQKAISILTEAPHVATPSTVDPDSGRPSLVEPAAPSELFGNFGG